MSLISHLVNDAGDFFLTDNAKEADRLMAQGWAPAAASFQSIDSGDNLTAVHQLVNADQTLRVYSLNPSTIAELAAEGWTDQGRSFSASNKAGKGLKPIYQLFNKDQGSYAYGWNDELIGKMIEDGWEKQDIAWYSPVNTGKIKITDAKYDPVTGQIKLDYSMDELHLSQFRKYGNDLTFRLAAFGRDATQGMATDIESRPLKYSKVDPKTGSVTGTFLLNATKALGKKPLDIFKSLSLSINSKYGQESSPDNGPYSYVRSSIAHFKGEDFNKTFQSSSGAISDIGYRRLYSPITPNSTQDELRINNEDLRGADWSNVKFDYCVIQNNNLSRASLKNSELIVSDIRLGKKKDIPYYNLFVNNNLSGADLRGFVNNVNDSGWDKIQGDMTNAITNNAMKLILSDGFTPSVKPSEIHLMNTSNKPVSFWGRSHQYTAGTKENFMELKPGQDFFLPGWALNGLMDVSITARGSDGETVELNARNQLVGSATFYINGDDQDDSGTYSTNGKDIFRWEFNEYNQNGAKLWEVRFI